MVIPAAAAPSQAQKPKTAQPSASITVYSIWCRINGKPLGEVEVVDMQPATQRAACLKAYPQVAGMNARTDQNSH